MIHTEQLAGDVWLFRYLPEGRYGDAYTFVCTGVRVNTYSIRLVGALGVFDSAVWDAMYEALDELGFTRFTARRNGEQILRRVKPKRKEIRYDT